MDHPAILDDRIQQRAAPPTMDVMARLAAVAHDPVLTFDDGKILARYAGERLRA